MSNINDGRWFREVLGQYPTGVCVVTASPDEGPKVGFVVGSFTSVSLDPPLVAFFPDRKSSTWPKIAAAGSFCVNILSAGQEHLCRQFSAKSEDKFQGVPSRPAGTSAPIIEDVVAWIDCELESVTDAGDHYMVLGRVRELAIENPTLPLLFFQGGYGHFTPLSLAAPNERGALTEHLREVDLIRSEMEALAQEFECHCVATVRVDDEILVVASAGSVNTAARATLVGVRLPFATPYASAFAAWFDQDEIDAWLKPLESPHAQEDQRQRLTTVRERGYSIGLLNDAQREFASALNLLAEDPHSFEPTALRPVVTQLEYDPVSLPPEAMDEIRVVAAPVFRNSGEVALALTIYGFNRPDLKGGIDHYIKRLLKATRRGTELLSDRPPVS